MVFKRGLVCSNYNWKDSEPLSKLSIEVKGLLLVLEYEEMDDISDSQVMLLTGFGKNKIKTLKRELRDAGIFVTQKTRAGFDYYIGNDAVNFYIERYGKVLDPTRVSEEYERYEDRIRREERNNVEKSERLMAREELKKRKDNEDKINI